MNMQNKFLNIGLVKILVGLMFKVLKQIKSFHSNLKRVLFSPIEKRKFSKYVFSRESNNYDIKHYLTNTNYYKLNPYNCEYFICIKYDDLIWVI